MFQSSKCYLPLLHPDDKVAGELMTVGCPLLGRDVEAADGVGELAATGRHLLLTQRSRITAGTLTAHVLQENSPVIPISIIKEVWWSGGQCPCLLIASHEFESRPGASLQGGLRGGRSHCNTV